MKVNIAEITDTLEKIITSKSKLSKQDARILAADYIEGELQGKKSHGIVAFTSVIDMLPQATADYKTLKETDSLIYADAQGSFGAIVGRKLADALMEKAKKQGVAVALIRDMKTWLRPATVAQYVAEHDMLAWVVNTGSVPMVAPPGGREPVIGTNPIGLGIPAGEDPMVADMATSTRAWGEVRLAKRFNHDLPEDSFLDSEGMPTLDPDKVHSAIPAGGHKGFAMGLLIQVLGGSLVDMNMGEGNANEDYRLHKRGACILVINPAFTVGAKKFKDANQQFFRFIKDTPPAKGGEKVKLPGDRATATKTGNLQNGYLTIDDDLWAEIKGFL
jgi:LDH2 family malate/lactate/ureidoglycolate dehydrogenase